MSLTKVTYSMINTAPINVRDYGAIGDGVTDDTAAINAAILACRTTETGSSNRTIAYNLFFPTGKYVISSAVEFAPVNGLFGFTVFGETDGSSWIIFNNSSTTLSCRSSSFVTFENLQFWSSGIDDDQTAFTINQVGGTNPLRTWKFYRCAFWYFYKCFDVSGNTMCSEFSFVDCYFLQDYILMNNNNGQAVNWNFYNCNWENEALDTITTKDVDDAAIFHLQDGTFSKWTGGSLVFNGKLAYYNLTSAGVVQNTTHKVVFDGVRMELVPNASNNHAPLVDKRGAGYVVGSNTPSFSLVNSSILNRGSIPNTVVYMNLWNNCDFKIDDVETEGGVVVGIIDSNTAGLNANLTLTNTKNISYEEDVTARVSTHDQHNVSIEPINQTATEHPLIDDRNCQLDIVNTTVSKRMWVRGPTGSLPEGGTTVNLPDLPDHFTILKLFCYRFSAAGNNLTVAIRDQADTTTYGTLTILAADSNEEAFVGAEMGYQIPSGTALMLKFTGTAEIVKGVVGLEYL